jgi:hypothetical protein
MINILSHKGNTNQNDLRFHLTPVRIAIILKASNNKCWQGCEKNQTIVHCWWECKLVQPLWKSILRFLKKLNTELPCDPAISLLYPKECKSAYNRHICTPVFIAALFTSFLGTHQQMKG